MRIFLDVDGVLNACCHPDDLPDGQWNDFQVASCMGFRILYSPRMGDALRGLGAEIIWLTTWQDHANQWISPLFGWPHFEVIRRPERYQEQGWWKSELLQAYVAENPGPFVWIDDDFAYGRMRGEVSWLDSLEYPYLAICPEVNRGLTDQHIQEIKDFMIASAWSDSELRGLPRR